MSALPQSGYTKEKEREVLLLLAIPDAEEHVRNYVEQHLKMGRSVQLTVYKTKQYLGAA